MLYKKTCEACGKEFTTEFPRTAYCSDKCRHGTARCQHCNKKFLVGKGSKGVFCSAECHYAEARAKKEIDCPVCKKSFYPATKLQKTCSRECAGKLYRSATRRENCENCGEPIQWKRGMKSDQKYCSRKCFQEAHHITYKPKRDEGDTRAWQHGYVQVKRNGEWIAEHKAVMEELVGRPLLPTEQVHHKNGQRADNRPENLELWIVPQPKGQRLEDWLNWLAETYPEEIKAKQKAQPT